MSDLISRSEVWKAFISRVDSICDLEDVREILDSIPTIEERKEGHWIKHIDDLFPADSTIECSVCHEEQYTTIDDNFCPNCGAKMEVTDEHTD